MLVDIPAISPLIINTEKSDTREHFLELIQYTNDVFSWTTNRNMHPSWPLRNESLQRVVPKSVSDEEVCQSSLGVIQRPRRTVGNSADHGT